MSATERLKKAQQIAKLTASLKAEKSAIVRVRLVAQLAKLIGRQEQAAAQPEAGQAVEQKPKSITVWLSESERQTVADKIAMFQKKAIKLGVEPVSMTPTGLSRTLRVIERVATIGYDRDGNPIIETSRKLIDKDKPIDGGYKPVGFVSQTQVTISGESPQLSGWKFTAKLEHMKSGNLVKSLPGGGPVDPRYLSSESVCEHCAKSRTRNETYVVTHDDGRQMQIGSSCLKDFLGHVNALDFAKAMEQQSAFFSEIAAMSDGGDPESDGGGRPYRGGYSEGYDLDVFMGAVLRIVREDGAFVSKAISGMSGKPPTAEIAWRAIPRGEIGNEKDKAEAQKVIEWAAGISDDQAVKEPYLNNLRVIARDGYVDRRSYGLAASMVAAYRKASSEAEPAKAESQWQGEEGKRDTFRLKVTGLYVSDGAYGETYIYRFRDGAGNVFVWYASARQYNGDGDSIGTGDDVTITATIKKHDEYKGVKQTVITRGKIKG